MALRVPTARRSCMRRCRRSPPRCGWRSISPTGRTISASCCACAPASASAVDVIEPCGFPLDDRRIRARRRSIMPARRDWVRHQDFAAFDDGAAGERAPFGPVEHGRRALPYHRVAFRAGRHPDAGQRERGRAGRASTARRPAGAVPLRPGLRSLNVATAAAIVLGEALRQTGGLATLADGSHDRRRDRRARRRRARLVRDACATGSAPPSRRSRTTIAGAAHARRCRPAASSASPGTGPGGGGGVIGADARPGVREGRRQRLDRLGRVQPRVPRADARVPRRTAGSGPAASRWWPTCARRTARRRT